jgi:hypothetical protein
MVEIVIDQPLSAEYAASDRDWRERFGRRPKEGARPLLILWPFGPVALVYDVMDTEGDAIPEDVSSFVAQGAINADRLATFVQLMSKKQIEVRWIDAGDQSAGSIRPIRTANKVGAANDYRMQINRNHTPAVQFATLTHELGHLFLGHLGPDKALKAPRRPTIDLAQRELEAESVAFIVCSRNGVSSKSETYLSNYIHENTEIDHIDLYQVMRAAGQVETLLGLTVNTKFSKPKPGDLQGH